jgi:hypothetical protein
MTQAKALQARIDYERGQEPDGCYYCGSRSHHTSDCHDSEDDRDAE